jgi:lysyl-tRNA synthetase class 2
LVTDQDFIASSPQLRRRVNLFLRARILSAIRHFFGENGYLEVETPVRVFAPLPEAHIDAVPADGGYLQTSPEACMKRLLAAGYSRIFQVCRCFRKGERGGRHLPEFTLLEWYAKGEDYRDLMEFCETLFAHIARRLGRAGEPLCFAGHQVDLSPPWPRLTVQEAFARYADRTLAQALCGSCFDEIMGLQIEPQLGLSRPVFLCDYPAAHGAFARRKPENPRLVERFELYAAGLELCNGFSELIDPAEQRRRFVEELDRRQKAGKEVTPMPERFLSELSGMPPAAGNALGVDRLVMLFAGAESIDEVTAFTPEEL